MNFCVLIPAHNEAKTIGALVRKIKAKGWDVVVVDDGSVDNSGKLAKDSGAVVLRNDSKSGKGFSLQKGFRYILEKGYEAVVMMDGDGQHDVEDVAGFVNRYQKSPVGIINGNRMQNAQEMPRVRYLTNRFMSWLISVVAGQKVQDSQCGFRLVQARVLQAIELTSSDFEIESEILIQAGRKGFKIESIPIKTIYEEEESKINPLKDTLRFIKYILREILFKHS